MSDYDVIIIGGGPNGLTAGAYISKEGFKTLLLERLDVTGGAGTTLSVNGFRLNPAATGFSYRFHKKILQDLELERFGLKTLALDPMWTTVYPDGNYVSFWTDMNKAKADIARFSARDADAYEKFHERWHAFAQFLGPISLNPPPSFTQFAGGFAASEESMDLFKELIFGTWAKTLNKTFENDYVKFGFLPMMEGALHGPRSCSPWGLCMHLANLGGWGVPQGGIAGVTDAMRNSAVHWGVKIKTNADVRKILVKDGKATGVKLVNGEEITANTIVSGLAVRTTMFDLVGAEKVEPTYVRRIQNFTSECNGITISLGLSEQPDFRMPVERLKGTFGVCPSYEYAEKAYYQYAIHEIPDQPLVIGAVQSMIDATVAPPGKHMLFMYIWPYPYDLKSGNWADRKQEGLDKAINALAACVPNLKRSIVACEGWTPLELEQKLGMPRGDYGHGEVGWDQLFSFRPAIGWSSYRTPINSLYLCGASSHPGPSCHGASGHNSAQQILGDLKKVKKSK